MTPISVAEFRAFFEGTAEFATIDPREEAIFARGHLLAASNLPLSRMELLISKAVPRKSTTIVLTDDDDGQAERTAAVLQQLGYSDLQKLAGGLAAWTHAGGVLISGVNVPGKLFGEFIEQSCGTPSISVQELADRQTQGLPTLLLDSRTPEEHRDHCVPNALSCPNGELLLRASEEPADPATLVVVHCAGRTRSIIGAQTLRESGLKAPVVAMENGTMAWDMAGLALEHDANRPVLFPEAPKLEAAQNRAQRRAQKFGVPTASAVEVFRWQAESARTTHLLDVRTEPEFRTGTLPGALHVPGGQLVQNVDRYLVVRNARVVLLDTDGVRAATAAAWLARMGGAEVYTLTVQPSELSPPEPWHSLPRPSPISAGQLKAQLASGAVTVVDLRSSIAYRNGHLPGAWFLTRARLEEDFRKITLAPQVVLVANDLDYAALVARDLEQFGQAVELLEGGFEAWHELGHPTESGLTQLASTPDDCFLDPLDFDDKAVFAREAQRYLDWEIGLVAVLTGDPAASYLTRDSIS